jgi:hypothetical protein
MASRRQRSTSPEIERRPEIHLWDQLDVREGVNTEIKKDSVEKCIHLVVGFGKKRRTLMSDGDSNLRAPKSIWQHLRPYSISPAEVRDLVPTVHAIKNVEPEYLHHMDLVVLADEVKFCGGFRVPAFSEKSYDLDSEAECVASPLEYDAIVEWMTSSDYLEDHDINSWILDQLSSSRFSMFLYRNIASELGIPSDKPDELIFSWWYRDAANFKRDNSPIWTCSESLVIDTEPVPGYSIPRFSISQVSVE